MKASSESGECASLILLVSFQVRTRSAWLRPALILPRDYPAHERVCRRRTGENVRVTGACEDARPDDNLQPKPNILACREQLQDRGLKGEGCTAMEGERNGIADIYSEETMRAMASSKEAVP